MTLSDILSYVGLGMWVLVVLLTLIGALKGCSRGFFRQFVRTLTVVCSVFISFLITNLIYETFSSWVASQGVEGILTTFGISLEPDAKEILVNVDPKTLNHILAIPLSLVLLPIVYVLSFVIVSGLMLIVHAVISGIFGFSKKNNSSFSRLLGAILGLAQGFAVSVICLVPIVGLASTISYNVADLNTKSPDKQTTKDVVAVYDEYIKPLAEHSSVTVLGPMGANLLYEKIATIEVNGTTYNMSKEIAGPALKIVSSIEALSGIEFENMSEEDKKAIGALIEIVEESPYVATLVADVLDTAAKIIKDEATGGESNNELVDALLSVFIGIKPEDVVPTLELVVDAAFLLNTADDGIDESKIDSLIQSINDDNKKADILAQILDAVATSLEKESSEDSELLNAILKIFIGIEGEDVAPTLEVMRDSMFLIDVEWENMSEADEASLDRLINVAKTDDKKANVLAKILDEVATALNEESADEDDFVSSMLSVFIDIEGPDVAPTLEILVDATFMIDVDWQSLTAEDRANLDALIDSAEGSDAKSEALALILDAVSDTFAVESSGSGEDVSGEFMESVFGVFKDIDKTEVVPTLQAVRDVLFMLDDQRVGDKTVLQVLSSNDTSNGELSDVFAKKDDNGDRLIDRVTDRLDDTERTAVLIEDMTKISLSIMAESMPDSAGGTPITAETYDDVKTGVKDIVSINQQYKDVVLEKDTPEYEQYVGDVSNTLNSTFEENGIEVEENVVNDMAEYVAENYKDNVDELSDSEVNDIILSYYEAYLNQQSGEGN